MRLLGRAALCFALTAAACGGGAEPKSAVPASEAATDNATPPSSNASAGAEFGVKECDEYMAAYMECVSSKVPEQVRPAMAAALERTKAQWKAVAAIPEGRAGLSQACAQARDAAKASMKAYGCSW